MPKFGCVQDDQDCRNTWRQEPAIHVEHDGCRSVKDYRPKYCIHCSLGTTMMMMMMMIITWLGWAKYCSTCRTERCCRPDHTKHYYTYLQILLLLLLLLGYYYYAQHEQQQRPHQNSTHRDAMSRRQNRSTELRSAERSGVTRCQYESTFQSVLQNLMWIKNCRCTASYCNWPIRDSGLKHLHLSMSTSLWCYTFTACNIR